MLHKERWKNPQHAGAGLKNHCTALLPSRKGWMNKWMNEWWKSLFVEARRGFFSSFACQLHIVNDLLYRVPAQWHAQLYCTIDRRIILMFQAPAQLRANTAFRSVYRGSVKYRV